MVRIFLLKIELSRQKTVQKVLFWYDLFPIKISYFLFFTNNNPKLNLVSEGENKTIKFLTLKTKLNISVEVLKCMLYFVSNTQEINLFHHWKIFSISNGCKIGKTVFCSFLSTELNLKSRIKHLFSKWCISLAMGHNCYLDNHNLHSLKQKTKNKIALQVNYSGHFRCLEILSALNTRENQLQCICW